MVKIALIGLPLSSLAPAISAFEGHEVRANPALQAQKWLEQGDLAITTSLEVAKHEQVFSAMVNSGVTVIPADGFNDWADKEVVAQTFGLATEEEPQSTPEPEPTPVPAPAPDEDAIFVGWDTTESAEMPPPAFQKADEPTISEPLAPEPTPVEEVEAEVKTETETETGVETKVEEKVQDGRGKAREAMQAIASRTEELSEVERLTSLIDEALNTPPVEETPVTPIFQQSKPSLRERAANISTTRKDDTANERQSYQPSPYGYCFLVTSGFGGSGKTTVSYYTTQAIALALKQADSNMSAILIEADYSNPKLQNRLNIPAGQDLSGLAKLLDDYKHGLVPHKEYQDRFAKTMEEITYRSQYGFDVIACPYDTRTYTSTEVLQDALVKAVLWSQRREGKFVVVDCDVIGHASGAYLDLAEMANSIVIVLDIGGDPVPESKGGILRRKKKESLTEADVAHLDDAISRIRALTTPYDQNGFGLPIEKISLFFNRTSDEEIINNVIKPGRISDKLISGAYDYIPLISKGWADRLFNDPELTYKIALRTGEFLARTTDLPEAHNFVKAQGGKV